MESIKSAFQALKNGIAKSKTKLGPDVLAALDKLSGVPDFLKLNVLPAPDFLKLSELLRDTIQPLFKHDLALTLHFASAVFLGIYNAKVTRIDDISERRTWEMAQSSVLSGILDYLDDHKSAKSKSSIGQAFFTTLCKLYFSNAVDQPVKADPDLLATVYMLLSDIVSGQTAYATALRKELMGGQRLGYTIYHIKAFLPLEAVLELFGNILFGLKGSSRDRAKLIRDVFTSMLYPNPSEFAEMLSKVTDSEGWIKASPRVIKLVASLDIAFTQPFEVKDVRLRGCNTKKVDNMYVDEKAFLVSIPVPGDSLDTLVIKFSDVEQAALSSSGQEANVTLKLNAAPRIGKNPVKCGTQNIEAHWTVDKSEVGRLIKSLKHRKVAVNTKNLEYSHKQLIAGTGITLQRETSSPPRPIQQKAEVIQILWGDAESNHGGTDCTPASPFLPILPPNFEEGRALSRTEEPSKTVLIHGESNLTDKPAQVGQMPPPSTIIQKASSVKTDPILMTKALSVLTRTLSAGKRPEQEQVSLRKKPGLLAKRKSRMVVSDEESELTDPEPPSPSPMRRVSLRPAPSGGLPEMTAAVFKSGTGDKKVSAPVVASLSKPPPKQDKLKLLVSKDVPGAKASAAPANKGDNFRLCPSVDVLSIAEASVAPRTATLKKMLASEPIGGDENPPTPPAKKVRPSPADKLKLLVSKDVPGAKASTAPFKKETSLPPRAVTLGKRAAPEPVDDDEDLPTPPAKKARSSPTTKPPPTRYGKRKLRNSSPINVGASDDDEPPKAPLKRALLDSEKIAVMKDRNGQVSTKKPAPRPRRKTAAYQNKENTPHLKSPTPAISLKEKSEVKHPLKIDPLSVKREAVTPQVKAKEAPKSTDVKRPTKPKQAPCQRDSFATNIQNQSSPPPPKRPEVKVEEEEEENSMEWEPALPGAFDFDFELAKPAEQEVIDLSDDSNASKTFVTEPVVEYWIPTKGVNDSFDEPVVVKMEQKDIEMIDLTSPVKPLVAPAVKRPQAVTAHKVEPQVGSGTRGNAPEAKVEEEDSRQKRPGSFSRVETPKNDICQKKSAVAKGERTDYPAQKMSVTHSVGTKQPEDRVQSRHEDKEPAQSPEPEVLVKSSDIGRGTETPATVSKKVGKLPIYPRMSSERPPEPRRVTHRKEDDGRGEYTLRLPRLQVADRGIQERLQRDSPKGLFERDAQPRKYQQRPSNATRFQGRESSEPADEILEVMRKINEGILDNINRRCDDTSESMPRALFEILKGAAEDLKPLYQERQVILEHPPPNPINTGHGYSVDHFNALLDIEAEYAAHRRKIMTGIDGFRKSAEQAGQAIKQITQNRGRHGLSKRFSATLFTKPVPTATLNF